MNVVLDTNVLVSAIIKRVGKPNQILTRAQTNFSWLTCEFILTELIEVLARKHIQTKYKKWVTRFRRDKFLQTVSEVAVVVEVRTQLDAVADPKDNFVLACAVDGRADYLVTGDSHLLTLGKFGRIKIITPAQFLIELRSESQTDSRRRLGRSVKN